MVQPLLEQVHSPLHQVDERNPAFGAAPQRLAWRIPSAQTAPLDVRILRMAFAGAICLAAVFAFGAGRLHWPALAAAGVLLSAAIGLWGWRRLRRRRNEDNVWLDAEGLHWTDGATSGQLGRRQVEGFRVGLDPDTVRAIPALTLILVGGFESQPVELHPPAASAGVRDFLAQTWRIAEIAPPESRQQELLYLSLQAALSASASPGDAQRLLLMCLVKPLRQNDDYWTVFLLPAGLEASCRPDAAAFRIASRATGAAPDEEFSSLLELVEYVDRHVLPADRESRERMLAEAEESAARLFLQHESDDARQAGFRWRDESAARRWRFQGERAGLIALCDRLGELADRQTPPPGARPAQLRVGGLAHGVTLEVNHYEGIAGDVLCATPIRMRELADSLRSAIESTEDGASVDVAVPIGDTRWSFVLEISDQSGNAAA